MFSPLLFNFLVNSLAAAIRRVSPGVRLLPLSDFRFTCQFYADDFLVLVESEYYLQHALTARILWGQQWRFLFRMGPEKSAAMVFGRARSRPSCSVFLSGQLLLVVSSYRYFGVVLISSLRLDAHFAHLISPGHRFFAQSTSWAHSEGFPSFFYTFLAHHVRIFSVPPSVPSWLVITRKVSRSWIFHNDDGDLLWMGIGHAVRFGI